MITLDGFLSGCPIHVACVSSSGNPYLRDIVITRGFPEVHRYWIWLPPVYHRWSVISQNYQGYRFPLMYTCVLSLLHRHYPSYPMNDELKC